MYLSPLAARVIVQTVLLSFVLFFIFSMPSKVMTIIIHFIFLSMKYVLVASQSHFNLQLEARR